MKRNILLFLLVNTPLLVLSQWSSSGDTNRGTQLYLSGGSLGYSIRTNVGGGWAWQLVDGNNGPFFHVEYPTGRVGIGTTSPQALLHVAGTSYLGTIGHEFYVASGYTFFNTKAGIRNNGGDVVFNSRTNGVLYLNRDVIGDVHIQSNGADIATFLQNGHVGIGVSNPYSSLHVTNGPIINSDPTYGNINIRTIGTDIPAIKFTRWTGEGLHQHNAFVGQFNNSGQYSLGIGTGDSSTGDQDVNSIALTVLLNGNVGIGNTNPDAKLAVSGQVHATEVRVTTSVPGPDYVFEKDYKLSSLEEIKNYIDQNKHLPEVPSAATMEMSGVQLGEMNMLLLKKIEELTLHLIEQNVKIKELTKKVDRLESRN